MHHQGCQGAHTHFWNSCYIYFFIWHFQFLIIRNFKIMTIKFRKLLNLVNLVKKMTITFGKLQNHWQTLATLSIFDASPPLYPRKFSVRWNNPSDASHRTYPMFNQFYWLFASDVFVKPNKL